jgi:hypothetical protein
MVGERYSKDRVGETQIDSNGNLMTLIEYNNARDITIQYEDGTIREHVNYARFKSGKITRYGSKACKNRVGEVSYNNRNLKMTITAYKSSVDITVKFEDGSVVEHTDYNRFKKGNIAKPGLPRIDSESAKRVGESTLNNHGERMTITEYNSCMDITVKFNNGNIREHVTYNAFRNGNISSKTRFKSNTRAKRLSLDRVGEVRTNFQGLNLTCIEYNSANDIKVQFDDGLIKPCRYAEFKNGLVSHDNRHTKVSRLKDYRVGEKSVSADGTPIEIIEYFRVSNITVKFETGEIKYRQEYHNFKEGKIVKPKCNPKAKAGAIGVSTTNQQGYKMYIRDYITPYDIKVEFEDGTIKEHQTVSKFRTGQILK